MPTYSLKINDSSCLTLSAAISNIFAEMKKLENENVSNSLMLSMKSEVLLIIYIFQILQKFEYFCFKYGGQFQN